MSIMKFGTLYTVPLNDKFLFSFLDERGKEKTQQI